MRFLIVAATVLACAVAAPSGALLGSAAWGVASPLGLGLAAGPVGAISAGDVQGAAIDAAVAVNNNARLAVDAVRQAGDQAAELQGRAINAAESHAWEAVNAAQIAQAGAQSAAAGIAPVVARSLAAPVLSAGAIAAPAIAARAIAAPAIALGGIAAPALAARAIAAPAIAAPALAARAIAAPAIATSAIIPGSQSISTLSISQTHASPLIAAPALAAGAIAAPAIAAPALAARAIAAPAIAAPALAARAIAAPAIAAPALAARAIAAPILSAPAIATSIIPGGQSISRLSISQTHGSPLISAPLSISGHGW